MSDRDSERFSSEWDQYARNAFLLMDLTSDNYITASQLERFFQVVGENPTRLEVAESLKSIKKEQNDLLSYDDCVAALKSLVDATSLKQGETPSPNEIAMIIGKALDPTNTGKLNKEALIRLLTTGESSSSSSGSPSFSSPRSPVQQKLLELLTKEEAETLLSELKISPEGDVMAAEFFSLLLDL